MHSHSLGDDKLVKNTSTFLLSDLPGSCDKWAVPKFYSVGEVGKNAQTDFVSEPVFFQSKTFSKSLLQDTQSAVLASV